MSQMDNTKQQFNDQAPSNIGDVLKRLKHVKFRGNRRYTADCPVAGHSTPGGHLSIEDADDKVLVTCFGSNHTYADICKSIGFTSLNYFRPGGISTTARPTASKATLPDFSELSNKLHAAIYSNDKAIEYLKSRLIVDWMIERWQLGFDAKRNAIAIPHMICGIIPAIKYRILTPGDHEPHYQCEAGSNLDHLFNPEQIETYTVYLCEGEFDAMVATSSAFNSCSLSAGAGSFNPEFVRDFSKQRDVFLPLDADQGGSDGMDKIKAMMPDKAIPVHLPDGMDITDFFKAGYSPDYLYHLAKEAKKAARLPKAIGTVKL